MKCERKNPWFYRRGSKFYEIVHHLNTLWTDNKYRKIVAEEAEIKKGDRVLDVGTGTGLTAIEAVLTQTNCTVTSIDISADMLGRALGNIRNRGLGNEIKFVRGDVADLPFSSSSFERIISCYGLGGVENIRRAFEEMVRVATPGAIICVAEIVEPPPEYPIRRFLHKYFAEPLFVKGIWGFRDLDLLSLFRESGIKVTKSRYFTEKVFGSTMLVIGIVEKSGTGKESC